MELFKQIFTINFSSGVIFALSAILYLWVFGRKKSIELDKIEIEILNSIEKDQELYKKQEARKENENTNYKSSENKIYEAAELLMDSADEIKSTQKRIIEEVKTQQNKFTHYLKMKEAQLRSRPKEMPPYTMPPVGGGVEVRVTRKTGKTLTLGPIRIISDETKK